MGTGVRMPVARQGVLDMLSEQGPVGQPGEGIVEGLMAEVLLEGLALGHVPEGEEHATDLRSWLRLVAEASKPTHWPWRLERRRSACT